jgi:large subunit ribosomal protein L35
MTKKRKKGSKKKKYKLKTHKGTAKRFRKTGNGKVMHTKGRQSHLRRRKSKRAKRMFLRMHEVQGRGIRKRVKKLAPNM